MGEALAELGRRIRLANADGEFLEQARGRTRAEPLRFE
jgi:hypothetical protein